MVTLRGKKMAERVGGSLLLAAGLPELVTDSMEEYTRLVQELTRCARGLTGVERVGTGPC